MKDVSSSDLYMTIFRGLFEMGLFDKAKEGDKFIKKDGNVVTYLKHVTTEDGDCMFFVFDRDRNHCYFVDDNGIYFGNDRSLDIVCRYDDEDEDDFITAVAIKEIGCFDMHLIEVFKNAFKLSKRLNSNEVQNCELEDTNWRRYV